MHTPDDVFNPIETIHTQVNASVVWRVNGIRLFVSEPGVISLQLRTQGPTDKEDATKPVACCSHAEMTMHEVDWLIAELTRLRSPMNGEDEKDAANQQFLDSKAAEYPFKVVTDKRGPRPNRLSVKDYGPIVYAPLRNNNQVYLFKTEEYATRFKRAYRSYIRNN